MRLGCWQTGTRCCGAASRPSVRLSGQPQARGDHARKQRRSLASIDEGCELAAVGGVEIGEHCGKTIDLVDAHQEPGQREYRRRFRAVTRVNPKHLEQEVGDASERVVRSIRWTLRPSSRVRMLFVIAEWERPSSSAAREKLRSRHTASNLRNQPFALIAAVRRVIAEERHL